MPRVPTQDNFSVAPTVQPAARFDSPGSQAGAVGAEQVQQFGQSLSRASDAGARIAIDMQQMVNQTRVDDALNKAKEAQLDLTHNTQYGYTNLKGIQALDRPDGKPLAEEYAEKYRQQLNTIAGSLGNDQQRQAFSRMSNDMLTNFHGQVMSHEGAETKTYLVSTTDGIIKTAQNDIALNYRNPDAVDAASMRIKANVFRQGQLMGKSAEWIEAATRDQMSGAHKLALDDALKKNDLGFADAYLKKYSKDMSANDLLAVQGVMGHAVDVQVGTMAADNVFRKVAPTLQTSDADRAFNIVLGTESNNQQFGKDGKPLTSSAGAIGIAQVMPATAPEAAKLAGLPWDEARYKTDAEYNKAIGKAYFTKQLQDFGGNLSQAFAAYNAGPGATQAAIKKGGENWLSLLPKETQDYVAKNNTAFTGGAGSFKRATLEEVHAQIRNDPTLAGNPTRLKTALDESSRRYSEATAAIKQQAEETVAEAQRQVIANGGNMAALPSTLRADLARLAPDKFDDVRTFAAKLAKGEPIETNYGLYYDLKSNPDALAKFNLMAARSKLSDADFKALVNEQADLRQGKADRFTTVLSAKDTINKYLSEANIDTTPKSEADKAKVGRIYQEFQLQINREEAGQGRKLKPEEIDRVAARMFTKVGVASWFGFTTKDQPLATLEAGQKVRVPAADREQITAALTAARQPITDKAIADMYRRFKGVPASVQIE